MSEPPKLDQDLNTPSSGTASPGRCADPDPASPATSSGDEAGYGLAESEPVSGPPSTASTAPPAQETAGPDESTFQPATDEAKPERVVEDFPDKPPAVDEVWSRWREWKAPMLWSAAGIGLSVLIMVGGVWVALSTFLLALAYGSYYIVISLEVPVRVTPEQAVREFYGAACHRMPNFRRMYTLLTADGRQSDEFTGFADFRAYWRAEVARLSRSPAWLVPLAFRIDGFRCRYNGEKNLAAIRYTLKVSTRGTPESDEPTAEFQMHNLAVKGPDGQWYLNDGTLPEPG